MCVRAWVWEESANLADLGFPEALTRSNPQSSADLGATKENRMICGFEHEKSAESADLESVNVDEFAQKKNLAPAK